MSARSTIEGLVDHNGQALPSTYEQEDREFVSKHLNRDAKVLEIGGRFGSVSCLINALLTGDKTKHLVIEPDSRAWEALQRNKDHTKSSFQVFQGALSAAPVMMYSSAGRLGAGATFRHVGCLGSGDLETLEHSIPTRTYSELKQQYGFTPTTLVLDCEGAFVEIFEDFPAMLQDADQILIEWDARSAANNAKYRQVLLHNGFVETSPGFHAAYAKPSSLSTA